MMQFELFDNIIININIILSNQNKLISIFYIIYGEWAQSPGHIFFSYYFL